MKIRPFLQRSKNAANHALGRQPMQRLATTFPDDVWLTSYPKSGNTWTRFLVANLVSPDRPADWTNIEKLVPDVYVNDDPTLRSIPRPRFIKSHEPYRPDYRRVLMIVRDPRDIAVSYYHFARKIGWIAPSAGMEEFIPLFLSGRMDPFGSWGENVGSWLGARQGTADFMVVRYEDLLEHADSELHRVAKAFGLPCTSETVANAVARSTADRLRELEASQQGDHKVLRRTRGDIPFVRKATAGQWRSDLPASASDAIIAAWRGVMQQLRYL